MRVRSSALAVAAILWALPAHSADYLPKSDDEVIWSVPDGLTSDPSQYELAQTSQIEAERLVDGVLKEARATGDPRLYGQAQAMLQPWWKERDLPGRLLLHRANIKQFNHQFDEAIADLNRYLKTAPQDLEAQLMMVAIQQVVGNFALAGKSCAAIVDANQMIERICTASNHSLIGRLEEASTILRPLESFLRVRAKGLLPYYLTTMGDIQARKGQLPEAIKYYELLLQLEPNDRFALAAAADLWLEHADYQRVLASLKNQTVHDSLLIRYAIAQKRIGDPGLSNSVAELQQRFSREQLRASSKHDREAGLFQLHVLENPTAAMRFALSNWQSQREPVDVRLFLDAAIAVKSIDELHSLATWMKSTGYRDAYSTGKLSAQGITL